MLIEWQCEDCKTVGSIELLEDPWLMCHKADASHKVVAPDCWSYKIYPREKLIMPEAKERRKRVIEAIDDLVRNMDGSFTEVRQDIIDECDEGQLTSIEEFTSWFDQDEL